MMTSELSQLQGEQVRKNAEEREAKQEWKEKEDEKQSENLGRIWEFTKDCSPLQKKGR